MRAFMSDPNCERAADWPQHRGAVSDIAGRMAESEARAILAETELVEGGYKACYVSVAYLCASLMPFNHNARVALAEALAAFVAEEE